LIFVKEASNCSEHALKRLPPILHSHRKELK
jgi:hypothetical protein